MKNINLYLLQSILILFGIFNLAGAEQANFLDPDHYSMEDGGTAIYYQQTGDYWSVSSDRAAGDGTYSLKFTSTDTVPGTQKAKGGANGSEINLPPGDYTLKVKVWLAADADIKGFAFNIKEPWTAFQFQIDTVAREQWVELDLPASFPTGVVNSHTIIRIDVGHVGKGTMYLDDFEIWGEKPPEPVILPPTSSIRTTDSARLSLDPGIYNMNLMVWKETGTTISSFYTCISEPWAGLKWDTDTMTEGVWRNLKQELLLKDTVLDATFSLKVNNNPGHGGGTGTLYIDDIEFIRMKEYVPVDGLILSDTAILLLKHESLSLGYNIQPVNATDSLVTWMSANPNVATVDPEGKVTATGKGETTVTAFSKENYIRASCQVTVEVPVEGISLSDTAITILVGEQHQLSDTVKPADASNTGVEWKSDAGSVVSVVDGLITGLAGGTAVVSVTTEDGEFSAQCRVTVEVPVEGISLSDTAVTIEMGEQYQLSDTVKPEDAANKTVFWISDADTVASVEDGLLTGNSAGTAVVSVTTEDGGFSAQCRVTVLDTATSVNVQSLDDLSLSPNPFTTEVMISMDEDLHKLKVYSLSGVLMLNRDVRGQKTIILRPSYRQLPPGTYILKFEGKQQSGTMMIIRK